MDHSYDDTIFSLATAVGRSATAMIRISGSRVRDLSSIFNFDMPEPKVAIAGNTSFPGECERCSCDVRIGDALCFDCSLSVPMFEQATSFKTVLDMLIQAEEDAVWNR